MSENSFDFSIIDYYAENEGYRCGYCKSPDTNYSHGMWAHNLTVQDYQDLIDRGWRRSGMYCYKPTMNITCCPMYTIRCDAMDFKLSKSQKKNLKRVHKFLEYGKTALNKSQRETNEVEDDADNSEGTGGFGSINDGPDIRQKAKHMKYTVNNVSSISIDSTLRDSKGIEPDSPEVSVNSCKQPSTIQACDVRECISLVIGIEPDSPEVSVNSCKQPSTIQACDVRDSSVVCCQASKIQRKTPRPGEGMDSTRPFCKKAKLIRQERKLKKLAEQNKIPILNSKERAPQEKSLEDFINESYSENPAHRLEIRLVRSYPASREFESTFSRVYEVYKRYQTTIHKESPEKCSERQFTRFLVTSPLKTVLVNVTSTELQNTLAVSSALFAKYQMAVHKEKSDECDMDTFMDFLVTTPLKPWHPEDGPSHGYGSFHQQYWLDGRLIAVGVLDILPKCVSSVYFFYDPEYSHLTLGTYGSLREVSFVRYLHHSVPNLRYYYMGFYIHSCLKMRYKGALSPSFLLCPEVYSWHPIERCRPLLDQSRYSRFNEDVNATDPDRVVNISEVLILWHHSAMPYRLYHARCQVDDSAEVMQYAQLVGNKCARRMLLIRS